MTPEISELVQRFDQRAATAGPRLRDAYACKKGAFAIIDSPEYPCDMSFYDFVHDYKRAFKEVHLPGIAHQMQVECETVPAFDPAPGTVLLAGAMGAEIVYKNSDPPWARPIFCSIKDVDHYRPPDVRKNPDVQRFWDTVSYFQDQVDGRIPCRTLDLQSPFTTAMHLRHYEDLLVDMMDDPRRVHKLLEIVTDFSLEFLEITKGVYRNPSTPGMNFPSSPGSELGMCIADDAALIPLSPAMYEEFCLPTMLRVAATTQGVYIHCCGSYAHQVRNLMKIPNLRGMQMHSGPGEMDPADAWRRMHPKVALWSDTNSISMGDEFRGDMWRCYRQYVLPRLLSVGVDGLILLCPGAPTANERQENVNRLRGLLHLAADGTSA